MDYGGSEMINTHKIYRSTYFNIILKENFIDHPSKNRLYCCVQKISNTLR